MSVNVISKWGRCWILCCECHLICRAKRHPCRSGARDTNYREVLKFWPSDFQEWGFSHLWSVGTQYLDTWKHLGSKFNPKPINEDSGLFFNSWYLQYISRCNREVLLYICIYTKKYFMYWIDSTVHIIEIPRGVISMCHELGTLDSRTWKRE